MGLHLLTIRRYQKEWQKRPADKVSDPALVKVLSYSRESCPDIFQSVTPREKEVPTEEVVHFQWFTGPEGTDQKTISKSKASVYHEIIHRKLQRGQHARSIYQDLVDEEHFNGSYDSFKCYIWK